MTATPERLRGRVSVHPRGFGFVTGTSVPDGRSGDEVTVAFIPPPDLQPFLADDEVECIVTRSPVDGRVTASRLVLQGRRRRLLVGAVVKRRGATALAVDRLVGNTDRPLLGDAPVGAVVLARAEGERAVVIRTLSASEAEVVGLLARHDLALETAPEVETAAVAAVDARHSLDSARRRDLRDLVTVTIDGRETRDIDDALSAFPPDADGALRVVVSIADVAEYVPEGEALDLDARSRGTSVYLPGHVLPMLPRALSEDALSLREGVDRAVLAVELRIDAEGAVRAVDVDEAIIRSTARLTYEAVASFLERGDASAVPPATQATLRILRAAAARLSQARAERGGRDVDQDEVFVRVDAAGAPVALESRPDDAAHRMVERLMVAANEAVARFLVERGLPGLYRVHEPPTAERSRALAAAAEALGIVAGFPADAPLSPRALAAFERQITGTPAAALMENAMRRLLGPARYQTEPSPHFGLAAPLYLHFTSPIRRYADLAVHRVLKAYLRGRRDLARRDPALQSLAEHLNDRMHRASRAEAERERVLVARLFAQRVDERVRAVVVGQKPQGALVQVDGALALLPGETLALGTSLDVEIDRVDTDLGRIDVRRPRRATP